MATRTYPQNRRSPLDGFLRSEVLLLARSAITALNVFVDLVENADDRELGLTIMGASTRGQARSVIESQAILMTRLELEMCIKELDPKAKITHTTAISTLREKFIDLKLKQQVRTIEENLNEKLQDFDGTSIFSPAGIVQDEESIDKGKRLIVLFDSMRRSDKDWHKPNLWRQHKTCDLRCVRPGGACPKVAECHSALTIFDPSNKTPQKPEHVVEIITPPDGDSK